MKKTILMVDDTASMRALVSLALEEAGYDVLTAADGQEGLVRLNGQSVHLVITDLNMPVMNGIEFIRRIREQEEYKHMPILLFSTESMETKQQAKDAGATGMLEKPMAKEKMLTHIRRLIR